MTDQDKHVNRWKPPYLYRYYGNVEHAMGVIQNRRLHHARPSKFNDPFDCRPFVSLANNPCDDDELWHELFSYLAQITNECSAEDGNAIATNHLNRGDHKNISWLEKYDEILLAMNADIRICCFAQSARNTMMWNHYANKHKGVVFQFRSKHLPEKISGEFKGRKVWYPKHRIGLKDHVKFMEDYFINNDKLAMAWPYRTKGYEWRGEEEIRFLTDRQFLGFPENALTGIILGDRCPKEFEERLMTAANKWTNTPRFFKVSISKSVHKLHVDAVKHNKD